MSAEIIGWVAALILLLTISRQVYTEWRDRTTRGLSKWLFAGQFVANWVFVVANAAMLVTARVGQWIYFRNKRLEKRRHK